ncbi:hypothetical protein RBB75_17920 [Tunturibacter empetritectus]|uniref:Uncharacterized protein n=1 Tax=Tunturiibacter empetritectus TaxID=3069691 RepID=A0AAU7ZBI3_9BACT
MDRLTNNLAPGTFHQPPLRELQIDPAGIRRTSSSGSSLSIF